ncbi:hypothetical protein [Streptomyces sp. NPDC020917]|uniref:hypothetical protein n=1 Tax=Streptomyces sp. NPDC020917 TaxID=3365102 RepID=UPI0037BCD3A2
MNDAETRAGLARRVLAALTAACPGARAELRGSMAAGTADAYSDIDIAWTVPGDRFGTCVDEVADVLGRVRPVASLRSDPEFADAPGHRLLFASFADVPLFWRLDLDVRGEPAAGSTRPSTTLPWPPAASALANGVAAVKWARRGREDLAGALLDRAFPRVGATRPPGGTLATDLPLLAAAATTLDPTQSLFATRLLTLLP